MKTSPQPILSEAELRRNRAAKILFDRIMRFCVGKFMDKRLLQEIEQLIYDHRAQCRNKGIDFPVLTIFPLVELGYIQTYPKDLDEKGIQTAVLNLWALFPNVPHEQIIRDLANGCRYAFPHFKGFGNLDLTPPKTLNLAQ